MSIAVWFCLVTTIITDLTEQTSFVGVSELCNVAVSLNGHTEFLCYPTFANLLLYYCRCCSTGAMPDRCKSRSVPPAWVSCCFRDRFVKSQYGKTTAAGSLYIRAVKIARLSLKMRLAVRVPFVAVVRGQIIITKGKPKSLTKSKLGKCKI